MAVVTIPGFEPSRARFAVLLWIFFGLVTLAAVAGMKVSARTIT